MFDDEVESITLFDPLTGQIFNKIPRYTVYPSSHYVTPRETTIRAMEKIKHELRDRVDFYIKTGKLVEAARIEAIRLVETDDTFVDYPLLKAEIVRREKQRIHFE